MEELWKDLKKLRRLFLNKTTVNQYIIFAIGKMRKIEKEKTDLKENFKRLYHALRVLNEAQRILQRKEPLVWMTGQVGISVEVAIDCCPGRKENCTSLSDAAKLM